MNTTPRRVSVTTLRRRHDGTGFLAYSRLGIKPSSSGSRLLLVACLGAAPILRLP